MCSTAREIMLSSLLSPPPTTVLLKMYTSFLPYLEGTLECLMLFEQKYK